MYNLLAVHRSCCKQALYEEDDDEVWPELSVATLHPFNVHDASELEDIFDDQLVGDSLLRRFRDRVDEDAFFEWMESKPWAGEKGCKTQFGPVLMRSRAPGRESRQVSAVLSMCPSNSNQYRPVEGSLRLRVYALSDSQKLQECNART